MPEINDNANVSRCPQCGAAVACGAVTRQRPVAPVDGSGGEMDRGASDVAGTAAQAAARKDANTVHCWCLDWPHLPVSARLGVNACLCPACLRAALLAAGVGIDGTAAAPGADLRAGAARTD